MKKAISSIIAVILVISLLSTNAFAYTTVSNAYSNVSGTYTVEVGVTRVIDGRSTGAVNSDGTFIAVSVLGHIQNHTTQKTIAVGIADAKYTTHQYNITTNRSGYTSSKLSALSTTSYTWQTVAIYDATNSYFAGLTTYLYTIVSSIEVRTSNGSTQGYYATPSITESCS